MISRRRLIWGSIAGSAALMTADSGYQAYLIVDREDQRKNMTHAAESTLPSIPVFDATTSGLRGHARARVEKNALFAG